MGENCLIKLTLNLKGNDQYELLDESGESLGEAKGTAGIAELISRVLTDRGLYLCKCSSCGHVTEEVEFWPSDGNQAPLLCPKCGSADCFMED